MVTERAISTFYETIKYQIPMTEILISKQCLVLEGFGLWIFEFEPARSCLAMSGGFIWNLPARRLFGGALGICIFWNNTPRQSHLSLTPAMREFFKTE